MASQRGLLRYSRSQIQCSWKLIKQYDIVSGPWGTRILGMFLWRGFLFLLFDAFFYIVLVMARGELSVRREKEERRKMTRVSVICPLATFRCESRVDRVAAVFILNDSDILIKSLNDQFNSLSSGVKCQIMLVVWFDYQEEVGPGMFTTFLMCFLFRIHIPIFNYPFAKTWHTIAFSFLIHMSYKATLVFFVISKFAQSILKSHCISHII